jgi:hypothetical protein
MRERIEELKRQISAAKKTGTTAGVASILVGTFGTSFAAALGAGTVAAVASPFLGIIGAGVATYALMRKFSEERDLAQQIKRLEAILEEIRNG